MLICSDSEEKIKKNYNWKFKNDRTFSNYLPLCSFIIFGFSKIIGSGIVYSNQWSQTKPSFNSRNKVENETKMFWRNLFSEQKQPCTGIRKFMLIGF